MNNNRSNMNRSNMNRKFRFIRNVQSENKNRYQPDHKLSIFYQICMFKDPDSSKYNIRILSVNENQEIVKVIKKQYDMSKCEALIESCKVNEYKIYPTYDLSLIDYPSTDDLLKVQSSLLSNDEPYSGYAYIRS